MSRNEKKKKHVHGAFFRTKIVLGKCETVGTSLELCSLFIVAVVGEGSTGNLSKARAPTLTEVSKLEAEINHLKRTLEVRTPILVGVCVVSMGVVELLLGHVAICQLSDT